MSTKSRKGRISYEPFLFALAILGAVYKLYHSLSHKEFRYDWTLAAVIFVFLIACALWVINTRRERRDSLIDTKITTGKIEDTHIVGAESSKRDQVRARVETGDAKDSTITGYREKDG